MFHPISFLMVVVGMVIIIIMVEDVPPHLILNWDQTGIHIVPSSSWTLETKRGIKRVNGKSPLFLVLLLLAIFSQYKIFTKERQRGATRSFSSFKVGTSHIPQSTWSTEETTLQYKNNIIVPVLLNV